ncbi:MAG: NVEALA domain-containing protein [Bacteroides sp.]|uniref:NVEALA domain-containing protein n=1 Tax=Bacteroides sp. TaxID=29523 RepID=UPI002FC6F5DB
MKTFLKVTFFLIAAVSLSCFCGHWNSVVESYNLSTVLLQNVEALANGETPSQIVCISSGSVDCPIMSDKVKYVSQGYGFMY